MKGKQTSRRPRPVAQPDIVASTPSVGTVPLDAQWARIGGGFTVALSREPVDVERLIVASAHAAHGDSRLFWVMASWIAVHHKLIDVRRLGRLLDAMPDDLGSAAAGA